MARNEPRSARKPIRRRPPPSSRGNTSSPFTPLRQLQTPDDNNGQDASSEDGLDEDVFEPVKPKSRATLVLESNARPARPSPGPSKRTPGAGKAPRMTKKQQQEAERERLRAYAAGFFKELNEGVFGSGIPEATELVWSKRLLTTAGRAHWKRWAGISMCLIDDVQVVLTLRVQGPARSGYHLDTARGESAGLRRFVQGPSWTRVWGRC